MIPVYQPYLNGNEKKYVNECLDENWISSKGRFVDEFQRKFAEYLGVKYALGTPNGTTALHLALLALGIGVGDEVIVPSFTYIASANAVTYTGAKPVFVDSLNDTWQMDPEDVEKKINTNTRAIMAVHLYGHPCDMERLIMLKEKYGLFLIEDCAESFGSKYHNCYTGGFGDISAFSFYGNKTITCGEGGMVITNDMTLYERALHLRGQGVAMYREYWHDTIGYNYRMTNICAAIGLAQLEQANLIIKKKREIAFNYMEKLKDTPIVFHNETEGVFHTFWMCSILTPQAEQRDSLRNKLKENGVETRPAFYPIHTMPMYSQKYEKMEIAEDIGWRGINLPSWPGLTLEDIIYICDLIKEYFKK